MSLLGALGRAFRAGGTDPLPEPASFPPPYRRMLAINSDVEWTSWHAQIDLMRIFAEFGLETGFSYWFFADPQATWRMFEIDGTPSRHAEAAWLLARAGALDTLHSFGGVINGRGTLFGREHIARGFVALRAAGISPRVYSNHGSLQDIQNIGGPWCSPSSHPPTFNNYQQGDVVGSPSYHLDLTLQNGVRFFWLDIDRVRDKNWFVVSAGDRAESLFTTQVCRDGSRILRFRRTDCLFDPLAPYLGQQINRALDENKEGYCVIYTHLGFSRDGDQKPANNQAPYLSLDGFDALRRLRRSHADGDTLVTTTARLLQFALLMAARPWTVRRKDHHIDVTFPERFAWQDMWFDLRWDLLEGFALPVAPGERVTLTLGPTKTREAIVWSCEGKLYSGLPWNRIAMGNALEEAARLAAN